MDCKLTILSQSIYLTSVTYVPVQLQVELVVVTCDSQQEN